ncbi:cysteine dioxygenase family protein [Acidovorax sp. NCPPB 3859]|nr:MULTISPECIES: cysteine dioxygenase family protein [unclassified Acidovorax]MDA8449279.1 cysteine dioxygenase family protein [Acidovorax sp. GBBC 3297]MDA8458633.1 cysteine dioxygenase family protein [Acidovorax sp. GBBC 3333]MDA8463670.1 cysteine dioxygenase family protein [Acidovorax sp. GBBC 3332]MDA8468459.1 cysteine dioxygenase family protein [Acidovorax sp. GBBC 3299]WCM76824.1 cysteine dioxygenase family protein [Acidovorax sp. GBBC 712]
MTTTSAATAATPTSASTAERRRQAVDAALADVRRLTAQGTPDRAALSAITQRLEQLAAHKDLFSRADFPPPDETAGVGASTRYRLNPADGDGGLALYLNSINPGKTTAPHNHTTWAVIVAVEGQEVNRLYERTDDRSDPARARIHVAREFTVQPGPPIAFLPDDIHSIAVVGTEPTLHFHLYGQPLETLTGRVAIDPDTGEVKNYNAAYFRPSEAVA